MGSRKVWGVGGKAMVFNASMGWIYSVGINTLVHEISRKIEM